MDLPMPFYVINIAYVAKCSFRDKYFDEMMK